MISVLISVYNEEYRIKNCISSFYFADQIIVLDKGSTDNTLNILKTFKNVDIINIKNEEKFNQNEITLTLEKVNDGWVIFATASDFVHPLLGKELLRIVKNISKSFDAIEIPYKPYYQGYNGSASPWHGNRAIKMIRRRSIFIDDQSVHTAINYNYKKVFKVFFKDSLISYYHLTHESFKSVLDRHKRYLLSEKGDEKTLRMLLFKIFLLFIKLIFKTRFFTRNKKIISLNFTHLSYYLLKYNAVTEHISKDSKVLYNNLINELKD